mmetsp:Transcript_10846/g.18987  ORF Transcript_10846/g.18987 Transcript_10846/m.18987 type:complete len:200 (-) Transcript_10846:178-777(-)
MRKNSVSDIPGRPDRSNRSDCIRASSIASSADLPPLLSLLSCSCDVDIDTLVLPFTRMLKPLSSLRSVCSVCSVCPNSLFPAADLASPSITDNPRVLLLVTLRNPTDDSPSVVEFRNPTDESPSVEASPAIFPTLLRGAKLNSTSSPLRIIVLEVWEDWVKVQESTDTLRWDSSFLVTEGRCAVGMMWVAMLTLSISLL